MENQIDDGKMQQPTAGVGALQKDEAPVAYAAAYWAWLRGQRAHAPTAEECGLTVYQAAGLIRQIISTDEFRKVSK